MTRFVSFSSPPSFCFAASTDELICILRFAL
jgi:hypothetical protein